MTSMQHYHELMIVLTVSADPLVVRAEPNTSRPLDLIRRAINSHVRLLKGNARRFAVRHTLGDDETGRQLMSHGVGALWISQARRGLDEADRVTEITSWLRREFWDYRTFGGTIGGGLSVSLIRGAVDITAFSRIQPNRRYPDAQEPTADQLSPGVYLILIGISPADTAASGFDIDDLRLLWRVLLDLDQTIPGSDLRLTTETLIIIRYPLPSAPKLPRLVRDCIAIELGTVNSGGNGNNSHISIVIDHAALPLGVEILNLGPVAASA
jgi:hypothetical protein